MLSLLLLSQSAPAGPLPQPRLDLAASKVAPPIIKVIVICRVYTQGTRRITEYCKDGFTCGYDNKCLPGPEMRRQAEAEKARRLDALQKEQKRLEGAIKEMQKFSQQASKEARRANNAISAAPVYSPNTTIYQPGHWDYSGSDPRNIPSPVYRPGSGGPFVTYKGQGQRPARNASVPQRTLSPIEQVQFGTMIQNLLDLRNSYTPNSDDWQRANNNLKSLDKALLDKGVDLKDKFTDVYQLNPMDCQPGLNGSGGKLADIRLGWNSNQIKKEAIDQSHLCEGVAEGGAMDACREEKFGQAVMWAEPEIAGQCRTANAPGFDPDAIAECAKRKFLDAEANNGTLPAPTPSNAAVPPDCSPPSPPPQKRADDLRERLRKSLSAPTDGNNPPAEQPQVASQPPADAAKPADDSKPVFGKTFPEEECAHMIGDYLQGTLDLKDLPERCQGELQKTLTNVMGPDADEIAQIKQYFEKGTLPPGAVGDAFGQAVPVEQLYGPAAPDAVKPQ